MVLLVARLLWQADDCPLASKAPKSVAGPRCASHGHCGGLRAQVAGREASDLMRRENAWRRHRGGIKGHETSCLSSIYVLIKKLYSLSRATVHLSASS